MSQDNNRHYWISDEKARSIREEFKACALCEGMGRLFAATGDELKKYKEAYDRYVEWRVDDYDYAITWSISTPPGARRPVRAYNGEKDLLLNEMIELATGQGREVSDCHLCHGTGLAPRAGG